MKLVADMREDAKRLQPNKLKAWHLIKLFVTATPFSASALYRFSHALGQRLPGGGRLLSRANFLLHGIDIDYRARIDAGVLFQHPAGVVIGRDCRIGRQVTIMSGVVLGRRDVQNGPDVGAYPTVGEYVLLGTGSVALGPVTIGSHSKVGAKALVLSDVAPHSSIIGVHRTHSVATQVHSE